MVQKSVLVLVILISSLAAHGQIRFGVRGVQGGPSFSAFERHDTDFMTNPVLGIWGKAALTENSAIIWEINYTSKGAILRDKPFWDFHNRQPYSIYSYSFFFRWIFYEVPIMLTFYFPLQRHTRLYFFSGPAILFYQTDKSKVKEGSFLYYYQPGMEIEYRWYWDIPNRIEHKRRFGYHLGLGIQRHAFAVELRYSKMDQNVRDLIPAIYYVRKKIHCFSVDLKLDLVDLIKGRK